MAELGENAPVFNLSPPNKDISNNQTAFIFRFNLVKEKLIFLSVHNFTSILWSIYSILGTEKA